MRKLLMITAVVLGVVGAAPDVGAQTPTARFPARNDPLVCSLQFTLPAPTPPGPVANGTGSGTCIDLAQLKVYPARLSVSSGPGAPGSTGCPLWLYLGLELQDAGRGMGYYLGWDQQILNLPPPSGTGMGNGLLAGLASLSSGFDTGDQTSSVGVGLGTTRFTCQGGAGSSVSGSAIFAFLAPPPGPSYPL